MLLNVREIKDIFEENTACMTKERTEITLHTGLREPPVKQDNFCLTTMPC